MFTARSLHNPKLSVSVVFVATMFMVIMDSTIVNVALPTLRRDFQAGTAQVSAVVTGYLVAVAVVMPAAAWLGDRVGGKRCLLGALALFTVASALAGLAPSLGALVGCRVLQGIAGGVQIPVGSAMIYRTFPPDERIRATRILMVPTLLAPALGPVLGGLLVDSVSWRLIFFVNVPVGLAALGFGARWLPRMAEHRPGRLDVRGLLLAGTGFPLAMYALSEGATSGWATPRILIPGVAGLALLTGFVLTELRIPAPLLRLRLLAVRPLRAVLGQSVVGGGGGFLSVLFLVPLFLQNGLGYSALHSGLLTFPEAVGGMIGIQISSRLFPRTGPRRLMTGGLAGATACVCAMAVLGRAEAAWAMAPLMAGTGLSMGFAMAPAMATALAQISREATAQATALIQVIRQAGSAIGVAVIATSLASLDPGRSGLTAYHLTFLVAAGFLAAGAAIGSRIRNADAAPAMKPPAARPPRNTPASPAPASPAPGSPAPRNSVPERLP